MYQVIRNLKIQKKYARNSKIQKIYARNSKVQKIYAKHGLAKQKKDALKCCSRQKSKLREKFDPKGDWSYART
jgi:hypothetical protein